MAESVFLECNAIHVPVQCKTKRSGWCIVFVEMLRYGALRYLMHVFGYLIDDFVYFGACACLIQG
jgi:hypothetical protein